MINQDLRARVTHWIAQDPDLQTREQLVALVGNAETDAQALAELIDAFRAPLEFGTAGLRGQLGAGPNRMNRVTVIQAAMGLAQYLLAHNLQGQRVVIGHDARHNSQIFAQDSARVLSAQGFVAEIFEDVVPTPVLAFAIRNRGACAGVMVTASHNPATDNGYKVYLGDGRQIVSPADQEISSHIRAVSDIREVPMSEMGSSLPREVLDAYIQRTSNTFLCGPMPKSDKQKVVAVYTAMHGVGWKTLDAVVAASGFSQLIPVALQKDPDPAFPTTAFPNPEEPGALDFGIAQARESNADVLLANDPDADRLAAAIPDDTGQWKILRGDQVGILLAWWIIKRAELSGTKLNGTFANSIVSSMMLEPLAISNGLKYEHTLTGFKWVSRVPQLIYGYEEALGYCVDPEAVGDKDGISAAAMFLEMLAYLQTQSRTVWQVLDDLQRKYGVHQTSQVSVRVSDLSQVIVLMNALRESHPESMGGLHIEKVQDLAKATSGLPATDAVIMHFGSGDLQARVIVRPSGTEPKIKCYLEVVVTGTNLEQNKDTAQQVLNTLSSEAQELLSGGLK